MSKLTRAKLELATERDVLSITRKDSQLVSTNPDKYVQANLLGYYVLLNTWLLAIRQYSQNGWIHLLDRCSRVGLFATIKSCSEAADELLHNLPISDSLMAAIARDVYTILGRRVFTPEDPDKEIGKDYEATVLFLFRFPKRFSPLENDIIQENTIKDFLNTENRSKLLMRRGVSQYWLNKVKAEMSHIIDWDNFIDEVEKIQPTDIEFTSGVCFDSKASLGSKLVVIAREEPRYFCSPFGFPYAGVYEHGIFPNAYWCGERQRPVKVAAVPKSYKSSRIIAMETVVNQGYAKAVSKILDRYMPDATPIHDQSVNATLAQVGSVLGDYATIDLSHASDTITKDFIYDILPEKARILLQFLGNFTVIGDKWRLMQQASTAGNALTFQLESLVFLACSRACTHVYELYAGERLPDRDKEYGYAIPSVYGDDIIVHSKVGETLLDGFKALGFIVNESKSYIEGPFRESCGGEYLRGTDVSSYYFPRFPIVGTLQNKITITPKYRRDSFTGDLADSLTSLVSLQHRLYYACYEASLLISELVKEAYPRMTTSSPGSNLEDLWSYDDTYVFRYAPGAGAGAPVSNPDWGVRTAKFLPHVEWRLQTSLSESELRLFELYKYQAFLRHGPRYEDPLMELLGISSPPITEEEAFGNPKIKWGYREVDYK